MKDIAKDFFRMSLMMVKSIENATEKDIEKKVLEVAGMASFKSITKKEILETIKEIEHVEGVKMPFASMVSDDDADDKKFEEWLTSERIEECKKNSPFNYSEDYENYLKEVENLPSEVISRIDDATRRIISKCGDPKLKSTWERRGMVVGSVQSGKTANYVSLINKAADYGYKIIIVITGIHENLRRQTQNRINKGFIGFEMDTKSWKGEKVGVGEYGRRTYPHAFSSKVYDFDIKTANRSPYKIDSECERPLIFTIKKNPNVLENLIKFFDSSPAKDLSNKINHPMIIIDDEADNASINTAYKKGATTKINSQIRKILNLFSNASYVGYTATPFANIFIDPDSKDLIYSYKKKKKIEDSEQTITETISEDIQSRDLFPRHFIVGLRPPDNYYGPDKLFGENSKTEDSIIKITDNEDYITLDPKIHDRYFDPDVPPSLKEAIICFFISDAIKNLRGLFKKSDSSMMINVSRFTDVQTKLKDKVKDIKKSITNKITTYSGLTPNLRKDGLFEIENVFHKYYGELNIQWEEVNRSLLETYSRVDLMEINQRSPDVLKYKDDDEKNPPVSYIVIGGFSLSRGITLKGLTISYILRNSFMYDTLLQMGRWFGYRAGYQDICRIWMKEDMQEDYQHITSSVKELMLDLKKLEKSGTPLDFGLKVLSHPDALMITARNKEGKSKVIKTKFDFSGRLVETFSVPNNQKALIDNYKYSEDLIKKCFTLKSNTDLDLIKNKYNGYFFEDIDSENIITFLNNFIATSYSNQLTINEPIIKYINLRQLNRELSSWDVFIPSPRDEFDTRRGGFKVQRRQLKINGHNFFASHRQKRKDYNSSFKLTMNSKVASSDIAKIGLSKTKIEELELASETNAKSNPKILNCYGRKPLLAIHLFDLLNEKKEGKKVIFSERYKENIPDGVPVTGWTIVFPESTVETEEEEYRVNDIWMNQFSFQELELSETEDNDDSDIYA